MTDPQNPEFLRWQQRYGEDAFLFGEAPNAFLARQAALLAPGQKALAVADGEARNGVWLAEQGLDVLSLDFSPVAQQKGRALAQKRGVTLDFICADVHAWPYPPAEYDVVVEIFTQFSSPAERARKWAGMKAALKPGGLLLIEGYRPKQLDYATGGPKQVENLYDRALLEQAFGDFSRLDIVEADLELAEGFGHVGRSAVIDLIGRK